MTVTAMTATAGTGAVVVRGESGIRFASEYRYQVYLMFQQFLGFRVDHIMFFVFE